MAAMTTTVFALRGVGLVTAMWPTGSVTSAAVLAVVRRSSSAGHRLHGHQLLDHLVVLECGQLLVGLQLGGEVDGVEAVLEFGDVHLGLLVAGHRVRGHLFGGHHRDLATSAAMATTRRRLHGQHVAREVAAAGQIEVGRRETLHLVHLARCRHHRAGRRATKVLLVAQVEHALVSHAGTCCRARSALVAAAGRGVHIAVGILGGAGTSAFAVPKVRVVRILIVALGRLLVDLCVQIEADWHRHLALCQRRHRVQLLRKDLGQFFHQRHRVLVGLRQHTHQLERKTGALLYLGKIAAHKVLQTIAHRLTERSQLVDGHLRGGTSQQLDYILHVNSLNTGCQ
mmetsp:Transcript_24056/g.60226  ORF Transcript_24056/g.60226 Transcript_24056/m.60226 type:complete len:341 (+) Transcript_24056:212-1234(+)